MSHFHLTHIKSAVKILCSVALFAIVTSQSQAQEDRVSAVDESSVAVSLAETTYAFDADSATLENARSSAGEADSDTIDSAQSSSDVDTASVSEDVVVIDGDASTGFLILDGVTQIGNADTETIYTNFYTEGGAGSGGGAGLGGTFFVNEGATLILENVSLVSNVVKGGEGGSAPAVSLDEIGVGLRDQETSVGSVTAFQIVPTLEFVDGQYIITGYEMTSENALVVEGNTVSIDGAMGSTNIASVSGSTVTLSEGVAVNGDNVFSLSNGVLQEDGVTVNITPPKRSDGRRPFWLFGRWRNSCWRRDCRGHGHRECYTKLGRLRGQFHN